MVFMEFISKVKETKTFYFFSSNSFIVIETSHKVKATMYKKCADSVIYQTMIMLRHRYGGKLVTLFNPIHTGIFLLCRNEQGQHKIIDKVPQLHFTME